MKMNNSYTSDYLLLGSQLKKIGENINTQISNICKYYNLDFEARWIPMLSVLNKEEGLSVQSLADQLAITHPAVVQLANQLRQKKFIKTEKLSADKRVTIIKITEKGKEKFQLIKPMLQDIESSISLRLSEIKYDVFDVLSKVEEVLSSKNIVESVSKKKKEKQLGNVRILPYNNKYKKDFKRLNKEWLEKYFTVEQIDEKLLNSPEEEIINKGGEVFFAILNNKVVGTCAALKIDRRTYELAKMAVKEKSQGKQVGKKLGLTVIGFAVSKRAKKIVLDTNYKLNAAIQLYRKLGFVAVPYKYENKYKRELIRMELNLR